MTAIQDWYVSGQQAAMTKFAAGRGSFGGAATGAAKPAMPAAPKPAMPAAPAAPAAHPPGPAGATPGMAAAPPPPPPAAPAPAGTGAAPAAPGLAGKLTGAYNKANTWLGTPMGSAVGQGVLAAGLPIAMDKLMGNGQQPQQGF